MFETLKVICCKIVDKMPAIPARPMTTKQAEKMAAKPQAQPAAAVEKRIVEKPIEKEATSATVTSEKAAPNKIKCPPKVEQLVSRMCERGVERSIDSFERQAQGQMFRATTERAKTRPSVHVCDPKDVEPKPGEKPFSPIKFTAAHGEPLIEPASDDEMLPGAPDELKAKGEKLLKEDNFEYAIEHLESALMKKIYEVGDEVHPVLAEFYYSCGDALYLKNVAEEQLMAQKSEDGIEDLQVLFTI